LPAAREATLPRGENRPDYDADFTVVDLKRGPADEALDVSQMLK
jgi:hypothetical protein